MKEIRIGIAGAGGIIQAHMRALKLYETIFEDTMGKPVIVSIADVNEEAAKAAALRFGIPSYYTDVDDVLNSGIDLVIIGLPDHIHFEVSKKALEMGIHVFCEKPLARTERECLELADLAEAKGLVNYAGYLYTTSAQHLYVKELVDSGRLGQITRVRGTFDEDSKLDPTLPIAWRHLKKYAESGALGDTCTHLLSALHMILGDAKRVVGISSIAIPKRPLTAGSAEMGDVETEDIVEFLIEFESGAIGALGANRLGTGRHQGFAYEIQGTKGSVAIEHEEFNVVHVYFNEDNVKDRGWRKVYMTKEHTGLESVMHSGEYTWMMVAEYQKLFEALNGKSYVSDFRYAAKVEHTVSGVLQSIEENHWVTL